MGPRNAILTISSKEMKNILKLVNSLEESGLLIKGEESGLLIKGVG